MKYLRMMLRVVAVSTIVLLSISQKSVNACSSTQLVRVNCSGISTRICFCFGDPSGPWISCTSGSCIGDGLCTGDPGC